MLRLIYPENRNITEREVIAWARDLMTDTAIEMEGLRRRDSGESAMSDEDIDRVCNDVPVPTLTDAIELLEDAGKATFRGKP